MVPNSALSIFLYLDTTNRRAQENRINEMEKKWKKTWLIVELGLAKFTDSS